jgi:hypothetical protein
MPNTLRELTPEEVAAGEQGIIDEELTATQIQALLRSMDKSKERWARLKSNKHEYEAKLQQDNRVLYFNYPSLFQMHAEDRVDSTLFELLALKRKIEKGEITPEQASAVVGQKLYQKFLPAAGAPPPAPTMSYEDYYHQHK